MSDDFRWRHFQGEIILWAVRWCCRYGISHRELAEMMAERGVAVDHTTVYRWVQRCVPEMERRLRWHWRRPGWRRSWKVDETYLKVRAQPRDPREGPRPLGLPPPRRHGRRPHHRLPPLPDPQREGGGALPRAEVLRAFKAWERPAVINTDKAGCYSQAIRELKREGLMPRDTRHRQVRYLNNRVEAEHGKLKRLIRPTLGFKSMKTACATLRSFEVMRALKKGQAALWQCQDGIAGEVRLVERAFGLGPSGRAEAAALLDAHLRRQAG